MQRHVRVLRACGNKNALKHGLYAEHFTDPMQVKLSDTPPLESLHEIYMLRAKLDTLLTLIEECEDEDRRVAATTIMGLMWTSGGCQRRIAENQLQVSI